MIEKILTGDQAIALGAVEADVRVVTGYPGSPGTKVLTGILDLDPDMKRHVEWSVNEKVAFEIALGASIGGDRSLVCLKSVGMNIAIDPIMTANLTGVNAGLVILLGDDPGALLSQNEQDTRLIMDFLELPLMEPSSPQEAKDMMLAAFDLSEEFQTVVIVREIRSLSIDKGTVKVMDDPAEQGSRGFIREKNKWVSTTFNVLENHRKLHDKLDRIEQKFVSSPFNIITGKNAPYIIAAGFTYSKLQTLEKLEGSFAQAFPKLDFGILKLGTIYPFPGDLIIEFLSKAGKGDKVLVLEDNEPYIENKVKTICHDADIDVKVIGKTTGHISREGEISKEDISDLLDNAFSRSRLRHQNPSGELEKTFCDGCPYTPTFQALFQVIKELGEKPAIIAEPGCAVRLNAPPFDKLDIKYSMGSAIGIASGLVMARTQIKPIALCGDSSFFHTGMNGLANAVANRANIFILVLDNAVTALTGCQPHPGTGYDARRHRTTSIGIEDIARACHVPFVTVINPDDYDTMRLAFRRALTSDELTVVVVRKPCPLAI